MSYYRNTKINSDKNLQAYVIGLAIGDGNLTNPNQRATRLRITCDTKYPNLIKRIANSIQELLPANKVNTINRRGDNALDVYVYSNHLEKLLDWKAKGGSKSNQNISIPTWIKNKKNYKIKCLRGLIETDGSIYKDRKYQMVIFSTIIPALAEDVKKIIVSLGFSPHKYKIRQKLGASFKYHVRLSKDVPKFLNLVGPDKS